MTCRNIPSNAVRTYDTIQQMYVGLGVRRLPSGIHANVSSVLPTEGLDLRALTPESVACFNTLTNIQGGSRYQNTPLHANISELRKLIDHFRGAGNTGDANIITGEEIDAYVDAFGEGKVDFNAQEYRDLTVANLSAYTAIVAYVGGGNPSPAEEHVGAAEEISTAIHTYGSVQQMYTGLLGETSGSARQSVSEDMPEGGIHLGALTEANIERFAGMIGLEFPSDAAEHGEGGGSQAGDAGTATSEASTPLARNAKEILELVDYFRQDGNLNGGVSETITSAEIDAYTRAYVDEQRHQGNRTITFDSHRKTVIGNLRALVACVEHVASMPPPERPRSNGNEPSHREPGLFSRAFGFVRDHWIGSLLTFVGVGGVAYAVNRAVNRRPAPGVNNSVSTTTTTTTTTTVSTNGQNQNAVNNNETYAGLLDGIGGPSQASVAAQPLDHERIAMALGQVDTRMESFYRQQIMANRNLSNLNALIDHFSGIDSLSQHYQEAARATLTTGRSPEELRDRMIFELVSHASGTRGLGNEGHEERCRSFESAMMNGTTGRPENIPDRISLREEAERDRERHVIDRGE